MMHGLCGVVNTLLDEDSYSKYESERERERERERENGSIMEKKMGLH